MLLNVLFDRSSDDPLDHSWFWLFGKFLQDVSNNLLDILRFDVFGGVLFWFWLILRPVLEDLDNLFGIHNPLGLLRFFWLVVSEQILHDEGEIIFWFVLRVLRDVFLFNGRNDFLHRFRSLLRFFTENFRNFFDDFCELFWLDTLWRFLFGLFNTILFDDLDDRLGDTWSLRLFPPWFSLWISLLFDDLLNSLHNIWEILFRVLGRVVLRMFSDILLSLIHI